MIELLIFRFGFFLGAIGAFLIGLVIGHTWGRKTGYKAALDAGKISPSASQVEVSPLHTYSTKMLRIQCARELRITSDMSPEDVALASRFEYHRLCEDVAKALMNQEIIRPVIVDGDIRPYRDIRRVNLSFYIAPDPAFEGYPALRPTI